MCVIRICAVLGKNRANIREISHERAFLLTNVGSTQPCFTLETHGFDHIKKIVQALVDDGYQDVHILDHDIS